MGADPCTIPVQIDNRPAFNIELTMCDGSLAPQNPEKPIGLIFSSNGQNKRLRFDHGRFVVENKGFYDKIIELYS